MRGDWAGRSRGAQAVFAFGSSQFLDDLEVNSYYSITMTRRSSLAVRSESPLAMAASCALWAADRRPVTHAYPTFGANQIKPEVGS
jgi:hypothetical protein